MAKLTFIAGLAAGYVLGARAGRQRYEQIRRTSGKVWNSGPVQKQVANAKEVARTKAAPVVADMVADAARATGEKLRSSRTVTAETIETAPASPATTTHEPPDDAPADRQRRRPVGGRDVAHRRRRLNPSFQAASVGHDRRRAAPHGTPATPDPQHPLRCLARRGRSPCGGTSSRAPRLPGPVPRRPLVPTPGRPRP